VPVGHAAPRLGWPVGMVARRVHGLSVGCPGRNPAVDAGEGPLGQRRGRIGLGRRRRRWLGGGQVDRVGDQDKAGYAPGSPVGGELGYAARWLLLCVVIVCGPGAESPGRCEPSGLGCATRACGRGAAAACSEHRLLDAGDALTCSVGGGGEGI